MAKMRRMRPRPAPPPQVFLVVAPRYDVFCEYMVEIGITVDPRYTAVRHGGTIFKFVGGMQAARGYDPMTPVLVLEGGSDLPWFNLLRDRFKHFMPAGKASREVVK